MKKKDKQDDCASQPANLLLKSYVEEELAFLRGLETCYDVDMLNGTNYTKQDIRDRIIKLKQKIK